MEIGGAGTFEQSLRACRLGGHISLIGVLAGFGKRTTSMAVLEQKVRLARQRGHGVIFFYWEGLWGKHVAERYRDPRRAAFTRLGSD